MEYFLHNLMPVYRICRISSGIYSFVYCIVKFLVLCFMIFCIVYNRDWKSILKFLLFEKKNLIEFIKLFELFNLNYIKLNYITLKKIWFVIISVLFVLECQSFVKECN